ncbi:hypothetical protein [Bradyrhizobium jicamae]|uniref:hypothetical protein n=1 Tax=Bradyrhizobium jicamae TaxID=280332 RepID=UPI001FDA62D0|nr:hypothetical protein [Bradyrhizobium jicamae]
MSSPASPPIRPTVWLKTGITRLSTRMDKVAVKVRHGIEVRNSNGDRDGAVLQIRYRKIRIRPPI